MTDNLVIVESPAKAKTIEKFLGKDYTVKSSFGHIRDLSKQKMGVDVDNNYSPIYIISDDKKKVVDELKKAAKAAKMVWLASDEDREGEAIAWHLQQVLNLDPAKTKRIVFHEITKEAILNAINNPRDIDTNLVNSQQARRVLDRMVGFEISPILWKKVQASLSAGRVQSVAARLIVEREREIMAHKSSSYFRVQGQFNTPTTALKAEVTDKFKNITEAKDFIQHCQKASFRVADVTQKPAKKSPTPPFTTSTLQQEAGRKFGFSVSQTMSIAQRLYEAGYITYMRTDSLNLSDMAVNAAKKLITSKYGDKYHHLRRFKTNSKGAQEAHEAIRPTSMERETISGNAQEQKLYELIWKRTIASQMSDAQIERTTINIEIDGAKPKFTASGEIITFDGFLKVYLESTDDEPETAERSTILPKVKTGDSLSPIEITATERFSQHPPRYNEPSLVKKMEELGIGRPSTYATTISTIISRGYILKEDRPGTPRPYRTITLNKGNITEAQKTENAGAEKSKLFPSNIGMVVNDFLMEHFKDIMSYDFTANVEKDFDLIAEGKVQWDNMIDKFYRPFHTMVEKTTNEADYTKGERMLGIDPISGQNVIVRIGRFGPLAQIGENDAATGQKARFASLLKTQLIETITLDEALELFKLPRTVGQYEGIDVVINSGRFGPYVKLASKFFSLKKTDDPTSIDFNRAIEIIEEGRRKERERVIKIFETEDIQLLNGRWGPYIAHNGTNYKIPKGTDAQALDLAACQQIISSQPDVKPKTTRGKKTDTSAATKKTANTTKSTAARKTASKKTTTTKSTAKTAKTTTKATKKANSKAK